jgi:hypothetical protein
MTALSWWDHYGPAACVAAFTLGFIASFIVFWLNYRQMERDMKQRLDWAKEDVAFWRAHALKRAAGSPLSEKT